MGIGAIVAGVGPPIHLVSCLYPLEFGRCFTLVEIVVRMEVSCSSSTDVPAISVPAHMVEHPIDHPIVSLSHVAAIIVPSCQWGGRLVDGSDDRAECFGREVRGCIRWFLIGVLWSQEITSALKLGLVRSGSFVLPLVSRVREERMEWARDH